jgi:uroporphyrinogen-III synthase
VHAQTGSRDDTRRLDGLAVGVVGGRKTKELALILAEEGASITAVEGVGVGPVPEVDEITDDVCARRPSVVVLTTDAGLSLWLDAADATGRRTELLDVLRASRLILRGPKVAGAAAAVGLTAAWCGNGSIRELAEHLDAIAETDVLVQLPPGGAPGLTHRLGERGIRAHVVVPYAHTAANPEDLRQAVTGALRGTQDAIVVTNRPAAEAVLSAAGTENPRFLTCAKAGQFAVFCLGMAAGRVLAEAEPALPSEPRLGLLARLVTDTLPQRTDVRLGPINVRGRRVTGRHHAELTPREAALLRVLSSAHGRVVTREALLAMLPGGRASTGRSLEVSVGRLRAALGPASGAVVTVPRRGYKLDPSRV